MTPDTRMSGARQALAGPALVSLLFGALTHLLWTSDARRAWRCVGTGLCLAAVAGVAVSRVVLNAHWVTDIAGGLTGGAAFLLLGLTRAGSCP
ncbi:MAG: hypothetical protein AUH29_13410 [Candidatus Rokubacteria bacterium 13_1_40CM_69_27]|nr:MAG: hypothetical protein AUH29_13410 [Candidatus Rokubacteria bacterium 13_1_40CM_69_27]OLC34843.1 MAG: hypothetical protein AUH81_11425 [Candidatus Rokubacteria bacterium 13_1_40CM_4_69_5]